MFEKSLKGPIIYIRHAQSEHNKIALQKLLEGKDGEDFPEKFSKELIDASITEEGLNQINKMSPMLLDLNFTHVFTSPLNRCIETLYYALKDHPKFATMKFYVHPLLNEKVSSSCDLTMKIEDKQKKHSYMNLDFKYFNEFYIFDTQFHLLFLLFLLFLLQSLVQFLLPVLIEAHCIHIRYLDIR